MKPKASPSEGCQTEHAIIHEVDFIGVVDDDWAIGVLMFDDYTPHAHAIAPLPLHAYVAGTYIAPTT